MTLTGIKGNQKSQRHSESSLVKDSEQENIAIRKHARFWDKKNKGYITPMDAVAGFTSLGYSLVLSVTMGAFLSIVLSYATGPSWVPDPRCRINVQKIAQVKQQKHGVYNEDGHFDPEKFEALFAKYAKTDLSGNTITAKELLSMINDHAGLTSDPIGWAQRVVVWTSTYILAGKNGVMSKEDVLAAYDGTLFYRLQDSHRPAIESGHDTDAFTVSGVHVPKSTVRTVENHLNQLIAKLPRSAVTEADIRLKALIETAEPHLLRASRLLGFPVDQDQCLSPPPPSTSPLTGLSVPTPTVQRKRLIGPQDEIAGPERLTGVKTISLDKQTFHLTGLQGVTRPTQDENEQEELTGLKLDHTPELSEDIGPVAQLNGVRPEGDEFYQNGPTVNWLRTGPLPGVKPSLSEPAMTMPPEQDVKTKEPVVYETVTLTGVRQTQDDDTSSSGSPQMPDLDPSTTAEAEAPLDDDSNSTSSVESSMESPHALNPTTTTTTMAKAESKEQTMPAISSNNKYMTEQQSWPILADVEKEE